MPTAARAVTFTVLLPEGDGERLRWGLTDESLEVWTELGSVALHDHQDLVATCQWVMRDLVKTLRYREDHRPLCP